MDPEEEAWKELEKRQERLKMDLALEDFFELYKPEMSPSLVRMIFEAGWKAGRDPR